AMRRGSTAIASRHPGIDYDKVPRSVADTAVEPGDRLYESVRHNYLRAGSPGLVLRPADAGQVVDALGFASTQDVPLGIRSGGHGVSGRSTNAGGIVLDMRTLDSVHV